MSLGNFGINRRQIREGGGRGNGNDHVDELFGCTELFIYQTPNVRRKGYEGAEVVPGSSRMRDYFHCRCSP